jgi:hypothetical protein
MNSDREYNNSTIKNFLQGKGVRTFVFSDAGQPYKNAIVERVIRTMRALLKRWTLSDPEGGIDWPAAMPDLIYNYNHTYHNSIKNTPADVWERKENSQQIIRWVPNKLKVGDKVRHLIRDVTSNRFRKTDSLYWSKNIYLIAEPIGARWRLSETSIDGKDNPYPEAKYMEYELKKVNENERDETTNRILLEAQRESSAIRRRMNREDLGRVETDDFGRPYIVTKEKEKEKETDGGPLRVHQLVISRPPRVSRPPNRYKP